MPPQPVFQNRERQRPDATMPTTTTYLITFVCYGAWLPGQVGAIPRTQNRYASPLPEPDARRTQCVTNRMVQQRYVLDAARRNAVLKSIKEVCGYRSWTLLAVHVRTNHVHVVTVADCRPEQVMVAFKAYSSRELNRMGLDGPNRRRWAIHGSTRILWTKACIAAAIDYVVRGQGEAMAVFEAPSGR
jgi:REP element-mobilizing transposase RayT